MEIDTQFSLQVDDDIVLALPRVEDADELFSLTEKNRAYLREHMGWLDSFSKVVHTKKFIENAISESCAKKALTLIIWYQEKQVGVLSCNEMDYIDHVAVLGYWLSKDFQGLGIMTKSVSALIGYLFAFLGMHRIEIRCSLENVRSQKIPERLGFSREGLLKEAIYNYGKYLDAYLYGLTKTDFFREK